MNDLEKENQELKKKIEHLEKWIEYYSQQNQRYMWKEYADNTCQRHWEIQDRILREKLGI